METSLILKNAKSAVKDLLAFDESDFDRALVCICDSIKKCEKEILEANRSDCEKAKGSISDVMIDRLMLDSKRIDGMISGIEKIVSLPSPIYKTLDEIRREDGLLIDKVSVPLGVVAIIYESRPNVTSDAAALSLKSGNVCILRCGKEAYASAKAIVNAIRIGLKNAGLPENAVQLIDDTSRESAKELMTARGYVDLLIPRGGKGLIRACVENATVPCIETGTGICHTYVDKDANLDMALKIIENAKCQRPSVCNAMEVCLVHKDVLDEFLPMLEEKLVTEREEKGLVPIEMHLCPRCFGKIRGVKASLDDFDTEFLDYKMAVLCVDSLDSAISHISEHSTHHSECIVSENKESCEKFLRLIDAAAVYANASTRFTDGGEFGLGCEMGISTQKMHARGPMGLREMTTYKYLVRGNGHVR